MAGKCLNCLQGGHYKRDCTNKQVCILCGDEGHESGGSKSPHSPVSEEELRRQALDAVARRVLPMVRSGAGSQPGGRDEGALAARQPGALGQRTPAGTLGPFAGAPTPHGGGSPARRVMDEAWPLEVLLGNRSRTIRLASYSVRLVWRRWRTGSGLLWWLMLVEHGRRFRSQRWRTRWWCGLVSPGVRRDELSCDPKVQLSVEGIPPHIWDVDTMKQVLGTSCTLTAVAPETTDRSDMGTFRADGWTVDPEGIPPVRELWVPEPREGVPFPRLVRRIKELGLLLYRVLIHVERIEEFIRLEDPGVGTLGGLPGSDQDGLPEAKSFDTGGEGYWTFHTRIWTTGVSDSRGPFTAGSPIGGRLDSGSALPATARAPSTEWRLPSLVGKIEVRVDERDPRVSRNSEELVSGPTGQRIPKLRQADKAALSKGPDSEPALARTVCDPVVEATEGLAARKVVTAGPMEDVGSQVISNPAPDPMTGDVASAGPSMKLVEGSGESECAKTGSFVFGRGQQSLMSEPEYFAVDLTGSSHSTSDGMGASDGAVVGTVCETDAALAREGGFSILPSGAGSETATLQRMDSCVGLSSFEAQEESSLRSGSGLVEPLLSFHGPNDQMQGVIVDQNIREIIAADELAAMGKMRRFCASILRRLVPPLLRELESAKALVTEKEPCTPRQVTKAVGSSPAASPPKSMPKMASAAESVLLKALGITPTEMEVDEGAI
ncbi:unnamed protein product [Alopecurus aequalis]